MPAARGLGGRQDVDNAAASRILDLADRARGAGSTRPSGRSRWTSRRSRGRTSSPSSPSTPRPIGAAPSEPPFLRWLTAATASRRGRRGGGTRVRENYDLFAMFCRKMNLNVKSQKASDVRGLPSPWWALAASPSRGMRNQRAWPGSGLRSMARFIEAENVRRGRRRRRGRRGRRRRQQRRRRRRR